MKRWLIALLALIIVILCALFIFIPSTIRISRNTIIDCSISAANRFILNPRAWPAWWPGEPRTVTDSSAYRRFQRNQTVVSIDKLLYNRVQLKGSQGETSFLNTIGLSRDTIAVQWQIDLPTSFNPIKRYQQYRYAKGLASDMSEVLDALRQFLHNKDNVYGIRLMKVLNGERSLLVLDSTLTYSPGVSEVYGYVAKLREAARAAGAVEIKSPMVHIGKTDSVHFFMMVALQTNTKIHKTGKIYYKHTYPGYTLVAEVKGGPHEVDNAISRMQTYIQDYGIISPAIPYAEMVTDRSQVTDTTQWVSRVYYPVF